MCRRARPRAHAPVAADRGQHLHGGQRPRRRGPRPGRGAARPRPAGRPPTSSGASCGCASTTWNGRASRSAPPPALMPRLCRGVGQSWRDAGRARSSDGGAGGRLRARCWRDPREPAGRSTTSASCTVRWASSADSEEAFRRVTSLAPDLAFGYYNLGHTLFLQGRYQAALSAYLRDRSATRSAIAVQASRLALCRLATGDAERRIERAAACHARPAGGVHAQQLLADTQRHRVGAADAPARICRDGNRSTTGWRPSCAKQAVIGADGATYAYTASAYTRAGAGRRRPPDRSRQHATERSSAICCTTAPSDLRPDWPSWSPFRWRCCSTSSSARSTRSKRPRRWSCAS